MINNVLIGVSTYDGHSYCRQEFMAALKKLGADVFVVYNGMDPWGFDGFELEMYKPSVGERGLDIMRNKQNIIREKAIKGGYSHLLMLESDNIPPDDVIERLLAHKKHVVSGFYFIKMVQEKYIPISERASAIIEERLGYKDIKATILVRQIPSPSIMSHFGGEIFKTTNAVRMWDMDDWVDAKLRGDKLVPMFAAGIGCVLIDISILKKISFNGGLVGEYEGQLTDIVFYKQVNELGYTPFCDIDCIVKHLHIETENNYKKWFDKTDLKDIEQ